MGGDSEEFSCFEIIPADNVEVGRTPSEAYPICLEEHNPSDNQ
jgi:hypothetical protein